MRVYSLVFLSVAISEPSGIYNRKIVRVWTPEEDELRGGFLEMSAAA